MCSSCNTAITKSALDTLARCNTETEVESPVMVITSLCDSTIFSSSSCGSTMVMLWLSRTKASAKCKPTSLSPAMTISIMSLNYFFPKIDPRPPRMLPKPPIELLLLPPSKPPSMASKALAPALLPCWFVPSKPSKTGAMAAKMLLT